MRELSLFSGAGGGLLGSKLLGWTTIGYVEFNDYCQRIVAQRIRDGILDSAPIFGDIRAFNNQGYAASYKGMVDVITGGFPCQPFSVAGKQFGANDERNMWPETIRTIRTIRPRFALLENVPGLLSSGYFDRITGDITEGGYDCRWRILSAAEMGAPHKRDRLWILTYSKCKRQEGAVQAVRSELEESIREKSFDLCETIPDANSTGFQTQRTEQQTTGIAGGNTQNVVSDTESIRQQGEWTDREQKPHTHETKGVFMRSGCNVNVWTTEPELGRVAHGVANRVERLKAIGNGQVPAVFRAAWNILSEGLV